MEQWNFLGAKFHLDVQNLIYASFCSFIAFRKIQFHFWYKKKWFDTLKLRQLNKARHHLTFGLMDIKYVYCLRNVDYHNCNSICFLFFSNPRMISISNIMNSFKILHNWTQWTEQAFNVKLNTIWKHSLIIAFFPWIAICIRFIWQKFCLQCSLNTASEKCP